MEVDNLNFKQLHNINEVERALFQGWTIELLDVSFVELFKSEKALTIVMPPKICIIGNWIKCCMCGDYYLVNKWTHSNKYVMPLSIYLFDALLMKHTMVTPFGMSHCITFQGCTCLSVSHFKLLKEFHNIFTYYVKI